MEVRARYCIIVMPLVIWRDSASAEHFIEVSGAIDKHLELIRGADHWGYEIVGPGKRGPRTTAGTDAIVAWMSSRFPLG